MLTVLPYFVKVATEEVAAVMEEEGAVEGVEVVEAAVDVVAAKV